MELPLSWMRGLYPRADFRHTALRHKQARWVHFASIPADITLDGWLDGLKSSEGEAVILRGCSQPLADALKGRGFDLLPVGMEAEIPLGSFSPGTGLRELERRAAKRGRIVPFLVDEQRAGEMQAVWENSVHAGRPVLKKLFRNERSFHRRGLAFVQAGGQWLAFITWSHNNSRKRHLEQMVRRREAPAGVMEALILELIRKTVRDGYQTLSLGEVPFFFPEGFSPGARAGFIAAGGRRLSRIYNARGLHHFKNKFHPQWQPVYICGKPKVSWLHLVEMAWHSRFVHLAVETYLPFGHLFKKYKR